MACPRSWTAPTALILALLSGPLCLAPATPPPPAPAVPPPASAARLIEPPDILLVRAGESLALPESVTLGRRLVKPDGTIQLGSCGSVFVAGFTPAQAVAAIAARLKQVGLARNLRAEQVQRELRVEVLSQGNRYFVVLEPDSDREKVYSFQICGHETVLDAVGQSDTFLAVAFRGSLFLVRRTTSPGSSPAWLPVDWQAITQRGNLTTNYPLRPGDVLFLRPAVPSDRGPATPLAPAESQKDLELLERPFRGAPSK